MKPALHAPWGDLTQQHQVADATISRSSVVVGRGEITRDPPHPGAAGRCCRRSSKGASLAWWFQELLISGVRHAPDRCPAQRNSPPADQ